MSGKRKAGGNTAADGNPPSQRCKRPRIDAGGGPVGDPLIEEFASTVELWAKQRLLKCEEDQRASKQPAPQSRSADDFLTNKVNIHDH